MTANQWQTWWPVPNNPPDTNIIIPYVQPSPIYVGYPYSDPQLIKLLERLTTLLEELTKMLKESKK